MILSPSPLLRLSPIMAILASVAHHRILLKNKSNGCGIDAQSSSIVYVSDMPAQWPIWCIAEITVRVFRTNHVMVPPSANQQGRSRHYPHHRQQQHQYRLSRRRGKARCSKQEKATQAKGSTMLQGRFVLVVAIVSGKTHVMSEFQYVKTRPENLVT